MHGMTGLALVRLRLVALACTCCLAACASHLPQVPSNVTVGAAAPRLPAPAVESNDASPKILAMHFSSLDLARGGTWSGTFVTGTNVASIEVRSSLFSIDVPRTKFGQFAFTLDVLDTPPIFVRSYQLRVIARNSAGTELEEDLPFRIQ
jgi:hypothetical protein